MRWCVQLQSLQVEMRDEPRHGTECRCWKGRCRQSFAAGFQIATDRESSLVLGEVPIGVRLVREDPATWQCLCEKRQPFVA